MNRFKEAIDIQNASNPSGVAHTFSVMAQAFMQSAEYKGTDSVREDPALRLIAYKLHDLMGGGLTDQDAYGKAYEACKQRAGE